MAIISLKSLLGDLLRRSCFPMCGGNAIVLPAGLGTFPYLPLPGGLERLLPLPVLVPSVR
jgi:hypothetical protein